MLVPFPGVKKIVAKIMLASDGSPNALRAADFTARLLEAMPGGHCTIVTVIPFARDEAVFLGAQGPVYDAAITSQVDCLLDEAEQLFQDAGIKTARVVLQGEVVGAIVDFAKQAAFDLIVVGSRGLGGVKGMLLGSVSAKVMQQAHCPVTVVK